MPSDSWLCRSSVLALNKGQAATGEPWSLIAHAVASNLKSTAPCLIQDLCNNYPSVLFNACSRRGCSRISIQNCFLPSTFFNSLLISQVPLLGLRELILLDCITDTPRELLLKVIVTLTRLPSLRHVICLNPLWSLINDSKVASELLCPESSLLSHASIYKVFNVSWYINIFTR